MTLTHAERAERYARAVVGGALVAGRYVKAACQRHLDDLARVEARDETWPYYFDHIEANRVCQFIEWLPHIKGDQARPQLVDGAWVHPLIELEDFQCFIVSSIFGWRTIERRLRRFRRAYIEVARKNAKSTLLAGIALEQLAGDGEEGPEVYTAATKRDQAKIIWDVAQEMVQRQTDFRLLGVGFNTKLIYCRENGDKLQPLARDYGSLDGLNTSCFISDELHAQKDRRLYDVLDSSTGARSQPLGVAITTAGTDREGVCYAQRLYVQRILHAVLHRHDGMGYAVGEAGGDDETYFGIVYTLDHGYADKRPNDDWSDEAVWPKANPMLSAMYAVDYARGMLEDMRAKSTKARAMSSEQPEFRTKHCNEWMYAAHAWMDMHKWAACGDRDLSDEEFRGARCCIGLDAAFKQDLFANVKVFERDGHYYAFGRYYAPERLLRMGGYEHFAAWAADGWISESPGESVDVEFVKRDLRRDKSLHEIVEVPFDPVQLAQFQGEMQDEGFPMVEIRPNVLNFSEAMKFVEQLVLEGKFHHVGDPVLEWMISNIVFKMDEKDNIYPRKDKKREKKIDGVIALIMAIARLMVNRTERSFWEKEKETA